MTNFIDYWSKISHQKLMLWCYLIWWANTVLTHFDSSITLWTNSLGISLVIGTALVCSVSSASNDRWQIFRLFWMPFAVSSFAALIKDKGYWVIFSPVPYENVRALSLCILLCIAVTLLKWFYKPIRRTNYIP